MNDDAIHRILALKRIAHPELARPLTWRGLQRVCARERVGLYLRRMSGEAQLVVAFGKATILVNADAPPRRHTYRAAHELSHLWLHVDPVDGRTAAVFRFDAYGSDDPREDEAEYLATILLQGPRISRSF